MGGKQRGSDEEYIRTLDLCNQSGAFRHGGRRHFPDAASKIRKGVIGPELNFGLTESNGLSKHPLACGIETFEMPSMLEMSWRDLQNQLSILACDIQFKPNIFAGLINYQIL